MTDMADHKTHVFGFVRAAGALVLLCLTVACVLAGGLSVAGLDDQARLNGIGAAVCGGAGVVGLLPVWAMSRTGPHGAAFGFLVGILFRMLVAGLVVFAAYWWWKLPDAGPLSMWIAGWYMLVLIFEVRVVSAHVMRTNPSYQGVVAAGKAAPGGLRA